MAIVRSYPDRGYTTIPDATLRDVRLSYRARGLLAAILSRPPGWRAESTSLAREGAEGREAVRTALRELERYAYLIRKRTQDAQGRWTTDSIVFDTPQSMTPETDCRASVRPTPGKPQSGEPTAGEPGAVVKTGFNDREAAAEPPSVIPMATASELKRRKSRASGIVTWYDSEVPDAQAIESSYSADAIAAACLVLRRIGKQPVPGLVQQELEKLKAFYTGNGQGRESAEPKSYTPEVVDGRRRHRAGAMAALKRKEVPTPHS